MKSKDALEKLRLLIGDELYSEVTKELSGETIYFPSNYEWTDKRIRNDVLKEDYYSGEYEVVDLAKKYDLSISHVYKIIQNRE